MSLPTQAKSCNTQANHLESKSAAHGRFEGNIRGSELSSIHVVYAVIVSDVFNLGTSPITCT